MGCGEFSGKYGVLVWVWVWDMGWFGLKQGDVRFWKRMCFDLGWGGEDGRRW